MQQTTMSDSTTKDSHYRLCKKVAQLTKVIVQLNTLNESYAADKQKLIDSHEAYKEESNAAHALEIKAITEKADNRVELLQNEIQNKEESLQDLIASSKAKEEEANKQLILSQNQAKERIDELQSSHEREMESHAQTVRDLSQSLEEQSRQHQENVLCLRNELAEEHRKRVGAVREEMQASHEQEIELLKSRHEQTLLRVRNEAEEEQKSAVENVVAMTRLEYEKKLSEQISKYKIQRDVTDKMRQQVQHLSDELERTKLQSSDVLNLRAELDVHVGNEKKLQAEVTRLQTSLDSTSSSNQKVITELQSQNAELLKVVQQAKDAIHNGQQRIESLEVENGELKSLLDSIDAQKSSLESELQTLSKVRDEERQLNFAQSEESEAKILSLQVELDDAKRTNTALDEQLGSARDEISQLSKYKDCVEQALPSIQSLKSDISQCKTNTLELTRLFASSIEGLAKWKNKFTAIHDNEASELKDKSDVLQHEVDRLTFVISEHERVTVESKTTTTSLEKKIEYLQEAANNAAVARTGERLSWEAAMDDIRKSHKKETARLCCMAQDEQDILGNQIAHLKDDLKKQSDSHERKCQLLENDWRDKMEGQNAVLSRVKFESALEIQSISVQMAEVKRQLGSKQNECSALIQDINSLQEQHELMVRDGVSQLEALSLSRQNELDECNRVHDEQLQQMRAEVEGIEREKENISASSQERIDELKDCIASERTGRAKELGDIKGQLDEFQTASSHHIENAKEECLSAVRTLKQRQDCMIERHCKEIEQVQKIHSEAEEALKSQITAATKEAKDAKTMLFSTIRETEGKVERALRHQKDDHDEALNALANENRIQGEVVAGKMRDLSNEYEALARANAKKVDVIIAKDKEINELKSKMSHTTKQCEEDMQSLRLQHEIECQNVAREIQAKDAAAKERLMAAHQQDMTTFKSTMQTMVDEISQLERAAKEKWESRPSLPKDEEQIKSLQNEVNTLSLKGEKTREQMLYFKRELENRDENFNKRFSNDGTPLRVTNDNSKPTKKKSVASTTRRKDRGKVGAGTRKKKSSTSSSSKLPKIAK